MGGRGPLCGNTLGRIVEQQEEGTQPVQLKNKTVAGLKSFKNYYGGHKEMLTYDDIIDLLIISYKQTHDISFERM